jgi:hypothetical protein
MMQTGKIPLLVKGVSLYRYNSTSTIGFLGLLEKFVPRVPQIAENMLSNVGKCFQTVSHDFPSKCATAAGKLYDGSGKAYDIVYKALHKWWEKW